MNNSLNLGIRAHDMNEQSFEKVIERVSQLGLNHIQLAPTRLFDDVNSYTELSPGFASFCRKILDRHNVDICVLGCYIQMSSLDPDIRKEQVHNFKSALRLASDFGANLVGTETGSVGNGYTPENYTEQAYNIALSSIKEMVFEAEKWGKTVAIEAGVNHPIHKTDDLLRLAKDIPSNHLQFIVDVANLMNLDNYNKQVEIAEDAISRLGNRIAVFHMKDYIVKDDKIKFVPVGQGIMDFEPVVRYAKYTRPGVQLSFEQTPEEHVESAKAHLQAIWDRI